MHDNDQRELGEALSDVLIEFNVLSLTVRRELVGLLQRAKTVPADLRTACEHVARINPSPGNGGAQIVTLIREDPQLRATLKAAGHWAERSQEIAPNQDGMAENMERDSTPAARRVRMAMRAHCAITYREARDIKELATQLGVSEEEAARLVEEGAEIYGGEKEGRGDADR